MEYCANEIMHECVNDKLMTEKEIFVEKLKKRTKKQIYPMTKKNCSDLQKRQMKSPKSCRKQKAQLMEKVNNNT